MLGKKEWGRKKKRKGKMGGGENQVRTEREGKGSVVGDKGMEIKKMEEKMKGMSLKHMGMG